MALINNIYGPDSAGGQRKSFHLHRGRHGRHHLFRLMASVVGMTGWFHPQALGLASGVGAGIMMASASASLCAIYPSWAGDDLHHGQRRRDHGGYHGNIHNNVYRHPLADKLYRILEPKLGRFALEGKEGGESGMRYVEWLVLFILGACDWARQSWIGYGVSFTDSIPGLLVLVVISMIAVFLTKVLPLKLPHRGVLLHHRTSVRLPISPVREFVIQAAGNINFTAPSPWSARSRSLAISDQLKTFISQGWKILIVGIFVMTGTFWGSCLWDQMILDTDRRDLIEEETDDALPVIC